MCLIVYSANGSLIERSVFEAARYLNPDGIGVMSQRGVRKFFGPKSAGKAWRHLKQLARSRIPYGIHFRFATHGDVTAENCHPFHAPHSDAVVMHNGVLPISAESSGSAHSDTLIFVERYMVGAPGPELPSHAEYYWAISRVIGRHNLFLIFHTLTGGFTICNESSGEWVDQFWYSNPYCLPWYFDERIPEIYEIESGGTVPDELFGSVTVNQREVASHRMGELSDEEEPAWSNDDFLWRYLDRSA